MASPVLGEHAVHLLLEPHDDRERQVLDEVALGERVAEWLRAHPELTPVDVEVRQSSDDEFHCFSITLFLSGDPTAYLAEVPPPLPRRSAPRPAR